jgi:hypothetical protein
MKLDCVVYDIEIARCIPDRNSARSPDLEYCAGWEDHAHMGIAVLCAFDTRAQQPRVFLQDNLEAFGQLIEGRVVAGFNNEGFDNKLLTANAITVGRSFDLLCAAREAVGEPRQYVYGKTLGGRKLEDFAQANLGIGKSMSGSLAPVDWQRDRRGGVIDYCMRDVFITLQLLQLCPHIKDPVTGRCLDLQIPT